MKWRNLALVAVVVLLTACGSVDDKVIPMNKSEWSTFSKELGGLSFEDKTMLTKFLNRMEDSWGEIPYGLTVREAISLQTEFEEQIRREDSLQAIKIVNEQREDSIEKHVTDSAESYQFLVDEHVFNVIDSHIQVDITGMEVEVDQWSTDYWVSLSISNRFNTTLVGVRVNGSVWDALHTHIRGFEVDIIEDIMPGSSVQIRKEITLKRGSDRTFQESIRKGRYTASGQANRISFSDGRVFDRPKNLLILFGVYTGQWRHLQVTHDIDRYVD